MERAPAAVQLTQVGSRLRRMNPWVIDALLTTAFLPLALVTLAISGSASGNETRDPDAVAYLLTIAAVAPYYFRRRYPLPVYAISTTLMMVLVVLEFEMNTVSQIALIGTYTIGAYTDGRDRIEGILVIVGAFIVLAFVGAPGLDTAGYLINIGFFSAAYFWGSTVRNRRLYLEEVEARAAAAEREKEEEAKRAVSDERLRIAQELHDVVAHSMGVIAVQAGVGAHVCDNDPTEAKKALQAIAETSRSTLTEIRRILGVLRQDGDASHEPAPGLADLDRLVRGVEDAGVPVEVVLEGDNAHIPSGVDTTAYRIVQEALTNVLKHAGPDATAYVRVGSYPGTVKLEIVDTGRGVNGRSEAGGGHGLVGMRERVGVYGGKLETGPRVGGGFRVLAELPYGETAE